MSIAKGLGKGIVKSVAKKRGRPKMSMSALVTKTEVDSIIKKMPEYKAMINQADKVGNQIDSIIKKMPESKSKKTETKIATLSDLKKMSSTQISKLKSKTVSTLNSKTKLKEFADKKSINLTTARNRLKTGLSNINKVTEDKKKTTKKPTTVVAKKTRKPDPKKKTTTSVTIVTAGGRKEPRLGTASVSRIDTALNKYKSKFAKARTNEEYLRIAKEMKKDPIFKGNLEKVKNLIAKSKPKGTGRLYIGAVRGTGKGTGKVAAVGGGGGGTLFTIGLAAGNSKKRKKKA
tara:strand:+ start:58 stop:924 length:867 start_codon:yes stop_codon:yes gene_type:complete